MLGQRPVSAIVGAFVTMLLSACAVLGASEITITARNDGDEPMVVQVIDGFDQATAAAYGEAWTVPPGAERELTLAVPGGDWTVTVNGASLLSTSDAGSRRGTLPVTLVLPADDHFAGGPYWEAPQGWADVAE